jgi:tetratricopeptide (TPR) repeat protein
LIAALQHDPGKQRRTLLIIGVVVLLGNATALGWKLSQKPVLQIEQAPPPPPVCLGAHPKLADVWHEDREQAIAATFAARTDSWAPDVAAEVQRRLDAWTERWTSGRIEACEATEVRGEQSMELMDLRIACYDRKLREFEPTVELLANADDQVARKAVDLVTELPALEACDDVEGLRASGPPPADPQVAAQVEDIRAGLAGVRTLRKAGRYDQALTELEPLIASAAATGHAPVHFEALRLQGRLLDTTGKHEQARQVLEQAALGSLSVRDDDSAFDGFQALAYSWGYQASDYEAGMRWARLAEALLARSSEPSPAKRSDIASEIGMIEFQASHFEAARRQIGLALALDTERLGPDHPDLASSLDVLGAIELRTGNYEPAREIFRRSLAIVERTHGSAHPDLAPPLNNLALAHERLAEFDEAAKLFERVLDILTAAHGPDHPNVGLIEMNLGGILLLAGKHDEAGPHLERAVTTLEQALGPDHPLVGRALTMRGDWELEIGEVAVALASYQRSLDVRRKALGPDHADLSLSHLGLGKALLAAKRDREAVRELERAVELLIGGDGSDPIDRGLARFALAQALARSGDRARVPELLDAAREDFGAGGVRAAADLAKLEAWAATQ